MLSAVIEITVKGQTINKMAQFKISHRVSPAVLSAETGARYTSLRALPHSPT